MLFVDALSFLILPAISRSARLVVVVVGVILFAGKRSEPRRAAAGTIRERAEAFDRGAIGSRQDELARRTGHFEFRIDRGQSASVIFVESARPATFVALHVDYASANTHFLRENLF